jgi:hypothetical protein
MDRFYLNLSVAGWAFALLIGSICLYRFLRQK